MTQELLIDGRIYISASDAAKESGLSARHITRLAKEGKIAARRLAHQWYVERAALPSHRTTGLQ